MLSYQHAYHAGNMADVHKHALLSVMLARLAAKDKPMCYIETHAGRGLYRLDAAEAVKTGEAAAGIAVAEARGWFPPEHPYSRALSALRAHAGAKAYPGSPLLACALLRPGDRMDLAELHPGERAHLAEALAHRPHTRIHASDGFAMARALCPPTPRRGLVLIDPSYEVKADYAALPRAVSELRRRWNVGVIVLWYPLLAGAAHAPMVAALTADHPDALRHEVRFPPARPGHRMTGSGLFVIAPPYGTEDEAARLTPLFAALPG